MRISRLWVIGLLAMAAGLARGEAPAGDPVAQSAAWLLQKSTLVHGNGMHNILLRALRQLHDPQLKPLFSQLVQKNHPALKIHGLLGLAELSDNRKIDLALVADLKDPATQAQLVSAAIQAGLLDTPQLRQLVTWPGLDMAVRVIAAAKLVHDNALEDRKVLEDAMGSENLAVRSTAAMLRVQTGDPRAMSVLHDLDRSAAPQRDTIRLMLVETALRYRFEAMGPWMMEMLGHKDTMPGLAFLALRGVLLFQTPGASDAWARRFTDDAGVAERLRLAVLGVDLADKLDAKALALLHNDKDPLVQKIGAAADALAHHRPAEEAVLKLLEENNVLASRWVLDWATDRPIDEARGVLIGIIRAAQQPPNPDRYRPDRLENAVLATQRLAEKSPDAAKILGEIVQQSPTLTQEAVLMGLIRSDAPHADQLIAAVPDAAWSGDTTAALRVLLRAKHGQKLTDAELEQLALIVRGGAGLQDPLRIQAAWVYVRLTHQESVTLASVLGK